MEKKKIFNKWLPANELGINQGLKRDMQRGLDLQGGLVILMPLYILMVEQALQDICRVLQKNRLKNMQRKLYLIVVVAVPFDKIAIELLSFMTCLDNNYFYD